MVGCIPYFTGRSYSHGELKFGVVESRQWQ